MHVFIDTNIFLNCLHFSKDDLDGLANVFATHEHGSATVHLTQQVRDKLHRNRESKINDALRRFNLMTFPQLPSFMKEYPEYEEIDSHRNQLRNLLKAVNDKVTADIVANKLQADQLISDIFARSETSATTPAIFSTAGMRAAISSGKPDSAAGRTPCGID